MRSRRAAAPAGEEALAVIGCGLEDERKCEAAPDQLERQESLSVGERVRSVDEAEDAAALVDDVAIDLDEGVGGARQGSEEEAGGFTPAGWQTSEWRPGRATYAGLLGSGRTGAT